MSYDLHGNGSWDEGPSSIDIEIRDAKQWWATCPPPVGIASDGAPIWPHRLGQGMYIGADGRDVVTKSVALQVDGWTERLRDPHWIKGYNPTYRLPDRAVPDREPDWDRARQVERACEEADKASEEARLDARFRELLEVFAARELEAPLETRSQREWKRDPLGCLAGRIAEYEAALAQADRAAPERPQPQSSPFAALAALRSAG